MTFIKGRNAYLVFVYLVNMQGEPWQESLISEMVYDQNRMSDRHKERFIIWAYKKKLINTKNLTKGIWLTEKGDKFVETNTTTRDKKDGSAIFEACVEISDREREWQ